MAGQGAHRDDPLRDAADATGQALTTAITLPGVVRSVAAGRRFVRETLGSRHPVMEKVVLGVSELATNAITHTPSGHGGQITIRLVTHGHTVRAEVTNDGTTTARPRVHHDIDAEHGRGILIVDALADAWGVLQKSGTTMVWAEFRPDSRTELRTGSWHVRRPDLPDAGNRAAPPPEGTGDRRGAARAS